MEIKKLMKQKKITQWRVARLLNINETTFSKMLRDEPQGELRTQIMQAIEILATDNKQ